MAADNSKDIEKSIKSLTASNKLSKEAADYYKKIAESISKSGGTLAEWEKLQKSVNDELDETSSSLSYIATAFKESVQELQKGNVAIKLQSSSLNKLSNIARDLRDIRAGEKEFTDKTLKNLQSKAKTEKSNLIIARDLLKLQGKSTKAIESQINDTNELLSSYQDIEDVNNKINKEFGITSGLVKGLGSVLKKAGLGDFAASINDASMETAMLGQKAAQLKKPFSANAQFAKSLFSNISSSISPLKIFEVTVGLIVKAFTGLDKLTGDTAKNLGISYKQSQSLNKEFTALAGSSDNIFMTTKNLNESFGQLSDRFSVTEGFSNEMLSSQLELTKQAGYQVESANEIAKLSLLTGDSQKDIAANALGTAVQFNAQNKLALNEKKLLEGISKTSSAIQLSLGNSTKELIMASATAKKYGLELSKVDDIAGSLLDFESSISAEMEAELLTGKELNLEKARTAALNNEFATVAEEIAKQVGNTAGFTRMNRIQQEALAKSVGMTREDLAKSLQDREVLAKLGTNATTAEEAYNKLLKEGLSQEEIAKKLGDDKLFAQLQANSTQEKFNQSLEKAQEIFVNIASILSPIISSIAKGIEYMANLSDLTKGFLGTLLLINPAMKLYNSFSLIAAGIQERRLAAKGLELGLGGQILAMLGFQNAAIEFQLLQERASNALKSVGLALQNSMVGSILKTIGKLVIQLGVQLGLLSASLATNAAVTFGVGVAVAVAAAAAGYAAVKAMTADDMVSPAGYGDRVLSTPKGSIALNDKDTLVAGTNLGQGGGGTDMSTTNALLEQLISLVRTEGTVYLDATKVGTAMSLSNYKMQ